MAEQSLHIVLDEPNFASDVDCPQKANKFIVSAALSTYTDLQTDIGFSSLLYKQKIIRLITDSYWNYLLPPCENILILRE